MRELRANTQVIVIIGPFPDVGDGFTPQTDIDISATNEAELLKHGSTTVVDISGATWAAIANCRGHYGLTLTTSHTDTEGMLRVVIQDDSDCLPVVADFMVLSEAAYDSKYVAKDDGFMDVNIKTIGRADTQETEANNLESACSNYSVTRGLAGTAVPAAAADAAGGLPISDAGGLDLDTQLANTNEVTAARMGALTDWINGGRLDLILDIIAVDTTTEIPALIATAQADLDIITDADGVIVGAAGATAVVDEWETQSQADPTGFHVNVKEVNGTAQTANDNGADINAILIDTAEIGAAGAGLTDLGGMSAGMKAEVNAEVDNAMDTAIASDPTARSANDFLIRAGTGQTSNMTINEATGAYSMKKIDDEGTEETFGGTKAASGTITSGAGVTTRNPA